MKFPAGRWKRQQMLFHPAPSRAPMRPFAVVVFAWEGDRVLLCDIPGRGWTVPSGRVEPHEDPREAARREAYEEAGATLGCLHELGHFQLCSGGTRRFVASYTTRLVETCCIPEGTESRGCRLATIEELSDLYHLWDPLMERVFPFALEVLELAEGIDES